MKKIALLVLALFVIAAIVTACAKKNNQNMPNIDHSKMPGMDQGKTGQGAATTTDVQSVWNFSVEPPKSGQNVDISIQINDKSGKPIQDFEIEHEKKMHLIVVSKDLSFFNHIHPDYKNNGLFTITTKFPNGGTYNLIADFVPKGSVKTTQKHSLQVAGDVPPQQPIQPDANLTKTVAGKEVTLTFDNKPQAGTEVTLTFNIKDAQSKNPITNLQPYLGAIGHVVILSADSEQYLHVHPMDSGSGPNAVFQTTFPNNGVYKIWGQFQHENNVFVVPFVVQVS